VDVEEADAAEVAGDKAAEMALIKYNLCWVGNENDPDEE
jgi:hypothetical protein